MRGPRRRRLPDEHRSRHHAHRPVVAADGRVRVGGPRPRRRARPARHDPTAPLHLVAGAEASSHEHRRTTWPGRGGRRRRRDPGIRPLRGSATLAGSPNQPSPPLAESRGARCSRGTSVASGLAPSYTITVPNGWRPVEGLHSHGDRRPGAFGDGVPPSRLDPHAHATGNDPASIKGSFLKPQDAADDRHRASRVENGTRWPGQRSHHVRRTDPRRFVIGDTRRTTTITTSSDRRRRSRRLWPATTRVGATTGGAADAARTTDPAGSLDVDGQARRTIIPVHATARPPVSSRVSDRRTRSQSRAVAFGRATRSLAAARTSRGRHRSPTSERLDGLEPYCRPAGEQAKPLSPRRRAPIERGRASSPPSRPGNR